MEGLSAGLMQEMLLQAGRLIVEQEPYLTEIDSMIGDGDHGIGMKRGFSAVIRLLERHQYGDIYMLCSDVSKELIKTMGGASGVIFGTMFLGGLEELPHGPAADAGCMARYFMEGERAIERRGKAKPGQKTMLDALYPACDALARAAERGESLEECFRCAWEGARCGVKASEALQSGIGRSRNFHEKTIGLPDPGAVSTELIWRAFYETIADVD